MEKMQMETPDMTEQNIQKIASLFPNCITEAVDENGQLKKTVNFELLKQMLSKDVTDCNEVYEFTWVGKKASIVEANKPIRKTLRPCPEESVDWDTTENLYIEGDNLDVLKLLQESYLGKVKMIYIDPPYNTGNDFIYRDNFALSDEDYSEEIGLFNEGNDRLFKNSDSNGRFHSDWCSMMYSRLMLARNLLSEDGVIFISIDDNEIDNMLKIAKEVFGEQNYEACITWRRRTNQPNDKSKMIAKVAENIIVFAKNSVYLSKTKGFRGIPLSDERRNEYKNPDKDINGPWSTNPWKAAVGRGGTRYTLTTPTGKQYTETWYGSLETFNEYLTEGRVWWTDSGNGYPRIKVYLKDIEKDGQAAINFLSPEKYGSNQEGSAEIDNIFKQKGIFDNPKPSKLIKTFIHIAAPEQSIVLDFFSGSATTADAVMQINAEDKGKRRFIMIQLPEPCDEVSAAYKTGYQNICEIGKERIRRSGEKIKNENPLANAGLDIGFRVFKLDDSNMEDVYYSADEYDQQMLAGLESNIKPDRTDLDLLFGCLLEWGLPISMPYYSEQIDGCTVHTYNGGDLIACFDKNIPVSVITEIAKRQPLRAVFRDSGFTNSPEKINVWERFKSLAPDTQVKVI